MARNGGDGMIAPTTRDGARELFASKLSYEPVSYTHLDVYKRQGEGSMDRSSILRASTIR